MYSLRLFQKHFHQQSLLFFHHHLQTSPTYLQQKQLCHLLLPKRHKYRPAIDERLLSSYLLCSQYYQLNNYQLSIKLVFFHRIYKCPCIINRNIWCDTMTQVSNIILHSKCINHCRYFFLYIRNSS